MPQNVLLIEDSAAFRKSVNRLLGLHGYRVHEAPTGKAGVEHCLKTPPDLVILDLVMPGLSGLEVCQELKQRTETASIPLLVLTGNDKEGQEVACLDLGADDYLTKPVQGTRLLAHVRALLRRAQGKGRATALEVGPLSLDYARKLVTWAGKEFPHLTPKEFGLLFALAQRSPEPLDRTELYAEVWGLEAPSEISLRTVDVHVRRIRLKMGWRSDQCLTAIHGRGYCVAPRE